MDEFTEEELEAIENIKDLIDSAIALKKTQFKLSLNFHNLLRLSKSSLGKVMTHIGHLYQNTNWRMTFKCGQIQMERMEY